MFFDSHTHYDDESFDLDRYDVINALEENKVDGCINIGASIASSMTSIELAKKYEFIFAAVGVHPHEVATLTPKDYDVIVELAKKDKVVAIGEIGLDFYYDSSPRDDQRFWFKQQLEISKIVNKPVIIHTRDASQETFDILKNAILPEKVGVIHCFSESVELAKEYVKMGFFIGVGGVVTFKNAKKLVEVVEAIPIDKILLETDCPYLAPIPMRGKRNDSSHLIYIAEKVAEIKGLTVEEVAFITKSNTKYLFNLK